MEKQNTISDTSLTDYYNRPYRPQFYFSPEEKWMNDPSDMLCHTGIYHIFHQYFQEETYEVRILIDQSSMKIFINEGQYVIIS